MIFSGYLYWKTAETLKTLQQVDRKEVLVTSFYALWIGWVICVVPYTVKGALYALFRWDYFVGLPI